MLNNERTFKVEDANYVLDLATKLTAQTWCLCNGFRIKLDGHELVFLNDSFSEDGAQEYAVFKDGVQVESITFGWIDDPLRAADLIRQVAASQDGFGHPHRLPSLEHPEGSCELCA